ncbi:uncharacterized protein RCC_08537 [Ramularia collo-cygni]|uniref:Helicase C-terminal domain-containing protein n=1 Tax=Ramularia collo-cygni TaxID=112498 RepID=A0A2D3VFF1_9PEZI|nr:uncharacterized protein RCC_08537 [Ramularia collo-cygni]CZT22831.1 uncharacterized protein RCC_08537 [Ramularia collo-cygni]
MATNTAAYAAVPSNYLGLGCLVFQDTSTDELSRESQEWQWLSGAPAISTSDASIVSDLAKLLESHWIRLQFKRCERQPQWLIYRVHVLFHDVARGVVNHQNRRLTLAVDNVLRNLDTSPNTWQGQYTPGEEQRFDRWATRAEGNPSLWYLFNTLPSPRPSAVDVKEKYAREALEDLLEGNVPGLRTKLFPYQGRAAAAMLSRECVDQSDIDPRLERRVSPSGRVFYYSPRDTEFLREPRYFQRCRGGILSETMGLGKTVMCLALIQATRHQLPKVPIPYALPEVRRSVASLADMAVAAINRNSVPWKIEFERIKEATGMELTSCIERLNNCLPSYVLPFEPIRWNRNTTIPKPERMLLAATSLVVVPRNLVKQWQSEIAKHLDSIRILVMDDAKKSLPEPEEICTFDIVLFSRNRFELEINHGSDKDGRRIVKAPLACRCAYIGATRDRDCTCLKEEMLYTSPLKRLHFKRLLIDEGHYASQTNNAILVVRNLITADHNWLVSGTPAKGLLGVEVDVSATDEYSTLLEQRRHFDDKLDRTGAIESLGAIAGKFLDITPWSERDSGAFKEYVYRHEGANTYSGFSACFEHVLAAMVIKTRPGDVELKLPPLHHKIVRIEPSYYDKMIANLFTLVLTANAVTSERVDQDYLFHKNSAKDRISLVNNLRQSTFWWTGFEAQDVVAVGKNSRTYLSKEDSNCTPEDRELLLSTLESTELPILESEGWKAMSRCHELGIFVEDWPEDTAEHWSFETTTKSKRVLTGLSFLLEAQRFVNHRVAMPDPGEGLAGLGIKSLAPARDAAKVDTAEIQHGATSTQSEPTTRTEQEVTATKRASKKARKRERYRKAAAEKRREDEERKRKVQSKKESEHHSVLTKSGIPRSSLDGEPTLLRKRRVSSSQQTVTGKRRRPSAPINQTVEGPGQATALLLGSPYARAKIVGTTSAKMSYLMSQILKHCPHEKILVFYEGDNIAYYIAQMLDLFDIKHEIYAKSLSAQQKAAYVAKFEEQTEDRVLLMDVKHASHGLNIPSASRIYFVNPVCRPDIEAQAIKRAHRIGQTREVYVETLVLKGTLEEEMLERSRRMTKAEHDNAKALEDDGGIREIIQSARAMTLNSDERDQMAPLTSPAEQLWGRVGWHGKGVQPSKKRFVDVTDHEAVGIVIDDGDDEEDKQEIKRQRMTAQ